MRLEKLVFGGPRGKCLSYDVECIFNEFNKEYSKIEERMSYPFDIDKDVSKPNQTSVLERVRFGKLLGLVEKRDFLRFFTNSDPAYEKNLEVHVFSSKSLLIQMLSQA
jgi:hypothetical protein